MAYVHALFGKHQPRGVVVGYVREVMKCVRLSMYALREEIYMAKHANGDHVALEGAFVTGYLCFEEGRCLASLNSCFRYPFLK